MKAVATGILVAWSIVAVSVAISSGMIWLIEHRHLDWLVGLCAVVVTVLGGWLGRPYK